MLRDKLFHHDPVDGFRWRSHEITRVEGFSDAVFGFAVTLLIVSLEVPHTSGELLATMRGFGAFVITFMMLAGLWYSQFTFFRRYGLEDRVTVILNLLLLFMVLFFVYPLKFLFNVILTDPRMRQTIATARGLELVVLPEHKPLIFAIFGAGFAGIYFRRVHKEVSDRASRAETAIGEPDADLERDRGPPRRRGPRPKRPRDAFERRRGVHVARSHRVARVAGARSARHSHAVPDPQRNANSGLRGRSGQDPLVHAGPNLDLRRSSDHVRCIGDQQRESG